jgi:predicted glycogen debranching enzyme
MSSGDARFSDLRHMTAPWPPARPPISNFVTSVGIELKSGITTPGDLAALQGSTMPTAPSKTNPVPSKMPIPPITLEGPTLVAAQRSEWLLTNGLGGFAMGTAWGTPTRKYHALLIAATSPPVGRVAALNAIDETLVIEHVAPNGSVILNRHKLSTFRFKGESEIKRAESLTRFVREAFSCRWEYALGGVDLGVRATRTLELTPGSNSVVVKYAVEAPGRRAWLELRPLVSLRDFHACLFERDQPDRFLVQITALNRVRCSASGLSVTVEAKGNGRFNADSAWWRNFEYARDAERGTDAVEDLFSPGAFVMECGGNGTSGEVEVAAWVDDDELPRDRLARRSKLNAELESWISHVRGSKPASANDERAIEALCRAADQFVAARIVPPTPVNPGGVGASIIAGYPWFSDWGRDTFVSLPGLLLATGRHDEALNVLESFASHRQRGLIPNCFDNATGTAMYNTVDASLFYIQAACAYLRETGDRTGFSGCVRQACLDIVDAYRKGTDFGIGVDPDDGLLRSGSPLDPVTWMDAKRDGVVFTPRNGKAVEINALWCSSLMSLAEAIEPDQPNTARELRQVADKAIRSFGTKFWNAEQGCLYDVLNPIAGDDVPNPQIRPNQIFAVSLPHSPLPKEPQRAVLATVRERLLTPLGLRTLDREDAQYHGRFQGSLYQRDGAYHNGTVWPWLIGPYAEAVLRVGNFSPASKDEARGVIQPLLDELLGVGRVPASIGQLSEVYDGEDALDEPRRPDGCMAQAWSIAELLRVMWMIRKETRDSVRT